MNNIRNKLILLTMTVILSIGFSGCNEKAMGNNDNYVIYPIGFGVAIAVGIITVILGGIYAGIYREKHRCGDVPLFWSGCFFPILCTIITFLLSVIFTHVFAHVYQVAGIVATITGIVVIIVIWGIFYVSVKNS